MAEKPQWHETLHDQFGQYFAVDNVLYHEKTEHQDLIIFENAAFGRVMALDGVVQTTERDEFIYHEMMTHVPLMAHGHAKHVLIIGGGDGAMLREVTRHKNVETTFDVIISDCTDPIGPGESLFTSAFYEGCKRCLNPGGIFVAQNGVCFLQQDEALDSHRKLSHYFADVGFYQAAIPTYYGGIMTFAWATDNEALRHLSTEIIQARFHASGLKCRYYNPAIHTAAFALPQYLQDALATASS